MRRRIIILLLPFVCFAQSGWAQSVRDEVNMLRYRNRELQRTVDSLRSVLNRQSPDVFDTWDQLEGIEDDVPETLFGGVHGLMSDEEVDFTMAQRVYASSPSLRLEYRSTLKKFIMLYLSDKRRRQMSAVLGRYRAWYPYFHEVFSSYGIPDDIIPLCIVESAVSRKARSKAGAVGLWQFMPETARGLGIIVDAMVDQRYDIKKETVAAARYLKNAYTQFGNWPLAVASYNCGGNNVRKAMIRSGKSDFWGIYDYLPNETRDYIPLLVAANYVVEYGADEGIVEKPYRIPQYRTITVQKATTFGWISQQYNCPLKRIKDINPEYPQGTVPAGYTVNL